MRIIILLFLSLACLFTARAEFDELFTGQTLRIDYVLSGNAHKEAAFLGKISKEKTWYGSRKHFRDSYINGNYYFEILDIKTGKIIYQQSFNTLFGEWQTTKEAKKIQKAFQQTAFFPCPVKPFEFWLKKRSDRVSSRLIMKVEVDPDDYLIPVESNHSEYELIYGKGSPENTVDLAFIAEGYSNSEQKKFLADVRRFSKYMFNIEPFRSHKDKFNIYAVLSVSEDSGTDNPGKGEWNHTAVETSFYTFGSERYLTTAEYWKVSDRVKNIPHDHILIMVNTDKYGGGGIFNHYSVFSSNNEMSEIVFIHEFGHGFAGLGDEYYNSEVAYNDFYPLDKEPLPPNLTTMVDFASKWKNMVDNDIPVPTPVTEEYKDRVGVFEGGGYVAKGVFRPQQNCRMKSNDSPEFCKVCRHSLEMVIEHYCK